MRVRPEACTETVNPSFLGYRQKHATGSASVSLDFQPKSDNEKSGLLIFQNEHRFFFLCRSVSEGQSVVQLYSSEGNGAQGEAMKLVATRRLGDGESRNAVGLRIESHADAYSFLLATRKDGWIVLKEGIDARFLSTRAAGGFVGCMYALYATSLGKPSTNWTYVDWFEYTGNDEVYR